MQLARFWQFLKTETGSFTILTLSLAALVIASVIFLSYATIFYGVTWLLLILAGRKVWLQLPDKKLFLTLCLVGGGIFLLCKPAIQKIDFWGDEIGVILLAQRKFAEIPDFVITHHVVVPPLDYQNLHWWLKLTEMAPTPEREFYWRVPYMVLHVLAGIFFSFIVVHGFKLSSSEKTKFIWLIFLAYLTNPLFFVYGFEVRFYGFSLLGLMLILYGLVNNQAPSWWWITIAMVLALNSTPFPIYLMILAGVLLFWQRSKLNHASFWIVFLLSQLLILGVFSKVLLMPNTGVSFSWQLFAWPLQLFWSSSKSLIALIPVAILLGFWQRRSLAKNLSPYTKLIFLSGAAYIAAIVISFILEPHPDIGVRHFILGLAAIQLCCWQVVLASHKKLAVLILEGILLFQVVILQQNFQKQSFAGKDFMYTKQTFQLAQARKSKAILFVSPTISHGLKGFYDLTMKWYSEQYHTPYELIELKSQNCQKIYGENKTAVFIKQMGAEIPCAQTSLIKVFEY